jgi:hypothetical protein
MFLSYIGLTAHDIYNAHQYSFQLLLFYGLFGGGGGELKFIF